MGNITRDIELRYTQGGTAIGSTAIASSRKFKDAGGNSNEEVLFVDITLFGRTAEIANQYLRKGSQVLIEGRLKLDQWTSNDGTKRSKHQVIVENLKMLGSRDGNRQHQSQHPSERQRPAEESHRYERPERTRTQQIQPSVPEVEIEDDEIPF